MLDPHELERALRRWRDAGVVDADRAAAIAAFEQERAATRPRPDGTARPDGGRRTRVAEAVGYVGAALAIGALVVLFEEVWRSLTVVGRLTLDGLLTAVVAAAAVALAGTRSAALQRLTSVLAVAAVLGVAWTSHTATTSLLGWAERDAALATALLTTAAAAAAHLPRPRPLPQLALLLATTGLLGTVLARPGLSTDGFWYAMPVVALGAAWVLLGIGGWVRPRAVATTSGTVLALVALQCVAYGRFGTLALTLALGIAVAAVVAAVTVGGTHHLVVGSLGLFVLLPQLVVDVFGDAIGAPATVLVVGLLLVLLAVGLGRARREVDAVGDGASIAGGGA